MKALLIEFNLQTGERAGGISPKDSKLPCRGWQNLDVEPATEIRLVEDDRNLTKYEGVKGVTILDGKQAINDAIDANAPPAKHKIIDSALMLKHAEKKGISLDDFVGMDMEEIAKYAFEKGLAGVVKKKIKLEKV